MSMSQDAKLKINKIHVLSIRPRISNQLVFNSWKHLPIFSRINFFV